MSIARTGELGIPIPAQLPREFLVVNGIYTSRESNHEFTTVACSHNAIRTHLCDVVARRVAEVTAADFGAHVPAVEGRRRELEPAAVEHHAGNGRHGVPPKAQVGEPLVAANTDFELWHCPVEIGARVTHSRRSP